MRITYLENPYNVVPFKGERILRYKNMFLFADRAVFDNGRVRVPISGNLSYNTQLGYFGEGVINAIGDFFVGTWRFITGAKPIGELPDGTKFYSLDDKVYQDYINSRGLRSGVYTYDTQFIQVGSGMEAGVGANQYVFTPQFEQLYASIGGSGDSYYATQPGNLSVPTAGVPSSGWNIPQITYNPASGSISVGGVSPSPGTTAPKQPGTLNTTTGLGSQLESLGSQAIGLASNVLPYIIIGLTAAIVIPPLARAVSGVRQ